MDVSAQPTNLANCPEEIIDSICSKLSKEETLQMSYVNHHIRRHTLPFLYRRITLGFTESFTPSILSLVRNVLASNDLANQIQHISIVGKRPPLLFKSGSPLRSGELDFMYQSIPEYCRKDERGGLWRESLEKGSTDAFCSLLLSRLGNLETLEVGIDLLLFSPFISDIFKASLISGDEAKCLSGYHKLRKVVYSNMVDQTWHDHKCMELEDILPLFYAPLIESIDISRVGLGYKSEWPMERPCASSLQNLVLHDTEIREEGLKFLLQATPELRSFECHFVWRADSARRVPDEGYIFGEDVVCEKLQGAINHVKWTLESLTLGQSYFGGGMQGDSIYSHGVNGHLCLKDFPRLNYVESSPNLLLGPFPDQSPGLSDVLPSSITHLTIRAHDYYHWQSNFWGIENDSHIEEISKYLENWKTESPNLKTITSGQDYRNGEFLEEEEELTSKLRVVCDNAGVGFSVKKTNTEYGGYPY